MLRDWELGLAVNHALSYVRPDQSLRAAIMDGKMRTRADVRREVSRMLDDDAIRKPRVLRFFRDFFDYDLAGYICKDTKALSATGTSATNTNYFRTMFESTASTDRLIELILSEDKEVLRELLTTQKVVSTRSDRFLFGRKYTQKEQAIAREEKKRAEDLATAEIAEERKILTREVNQLEAEAKSNKSDKPLQKNLARKQKELKDLIKKMADMKRKAGGNINTRVDEVDFSGKQIFARSQSTILWTWFHETGKDPLDCAEGSTVGHSDPPELAGFSFRRYGQPCDSPRNLGAGTVAWWRDSRCTYYCGCPAS